MSILSRNNIPKLRFSEFTKEWKQRSLSDFVISYRGGAPLAPSDFVEHSNSEVVPKKAIVPGGILNLDESNPTFCTDEFFAKNDKSVIDERYMLTTLRDLVPTGPSIGLIVTNPHKKKMILAQGVYGFLLTDELVPTFLTSISNKEDYRRLMFKIAVGSTQIHIRNSEFFRIKLFVPSIEEQRKIAEFLGSVDAKLDALRHKRALLAEYKRGVMQKLFSQEIRFRQDDGRPFPNWKIKKVIEIAPLQRGFDLPTQLIVEGEYPIVYSNGVLKTHHEYKATAPGVVTGRSGTIGNITFVEENYWPHNTSLWVTDFKGNDPRFIYYFYITLKLERYSTGSGVPTLNRNDVHAVKVKIPTDVGEQRKIATFLAAIDEKITAVVRQIEHMETFKKGLLQQMFV